MTGESAGDGTSQAFATADDGTRLFVRTRPKRGASTEPKSQQVHAVLCDGIACDGFIWKYLYDDLAEAAPVVHWHYRGHGRSAMPADKNRVDIAAHADDLAAVRRSVGDPPVVLLGHSMGCQVVLEELRRHGDKVRGIVLLCGSYGRVTKTFRGVPILDMVLPKIVEAVHKHPALVRAVWERIPTEIALKLALKAGDLDQTRFSMEDMRPYVTHMRAMDLRLFLAMLSAAGEHSAEDLLPKITVPTLVVAGERDTFTPLFLAESMAKSIPPAELLVAKEGSHAAPLEQHELIDEKILAFLRERVLGESR
ncbi:MAG TPA: alpha/beta hydrolase [Polyangiaceae bacterium]|nr:alpha/beta hydrolase [Polyangiaceae bacterium]